MRRAVFSLLVENSAGVLSRVSGMFSRRGYNIDSLTVGETMDSNFSRMTVVARGDDNVLEQIHKQLAKLIDVKEIIELPAGDSVCRELVLVRVECDLSQRADVVTLANIFHAKVIDVAPESMIIELIGDFNKLEAFIELLDGFKVTELARTGITGLARGFANLDY